MCVCVCANVCLCVFAYVWAYVCVRVMRECMFVRSCVCASSLTSQPHFCLYAHAQADVGAGRVRLGRPARFLW